MDIQWITGIRLGFNVTLIAIYVQKDTYITPSDIVGGCTIS